MWPMHGFKMFHTWLYINLLKQTSFSWLSYVILLVLRHFLCNFRAFKFTFYMTTYLLLIVIVNFRCTNFENYWKWIIALMKNFFHWRIILKYLELSNNSLKNSRHRIVFKETELELESQIKYYIYYYLEFFTSVLCCHCKVYLL